MDGWAPREVPEEGRCVRVSCAVCWHKVHGKRRAQAPPTCRHPPPPLFLPPPPPSFPPPPQGFAEKLFKRLQGGHERFETRLAMVNVVSRAVGVHKLLLLNFYPFLQKYVAPHQRDVTVILAALVQASLVVVVRVVCGAVQCSAVQCCAVLCRAE